MAPKFTIAKVIRLLKKECPMTVEGFRTLGIELEYLSEGCFRKTYTVKGLKLVVKLPMDDENPDEESAADHSAGEMRRIKRVKADPLLEKHAPKVYLHDRKTGVIVMQYYPDKFDSFYACRLLTKLIKKLSHISIEDLSEANIRVHNGELKFIDLGY